MLRIEPTISTNFKAKSEAKSDIISDRAQNKNNGEKSMLAGTLAGLATLGAVAIGLKKTSPVSYEEALKKAGVQIKDNVATLIETGEKFTGKIQRFEKRNRKETVEFVDGLMTEKVYHNMFDRELNGQFFKDGKKAFTIQKIGKNKYSVHPHIDFIDKFVITKPAPYIEIEDGFAWAREYIKDMDKNKLLKVLRYEKNSL